VPFEALQFAVAFRFATDLIFKLELRSLTGTSDVELEGKKNPDSNIGYLIDPDIAIN